MDRRAVGTAYEKWAGKYLIRQGYEIIEYNFYCRSGEIDIIARDGEYLVFVEVKYRKNAKNGAPIEAVTEKKQKAISKVASYYCLVHGYGENTPCRFDVVGILGDEVSLIKNAFDYAVY